MQLAFQLQRDWPKLAWVARCTPNDNQVCILHGPMVETGPNWLVEGVWDGSFSEGRFDEESILVGSGVVLRGDRLLFIPSTNYTDRLWYARTARDYCVANTLAGLLAVTGITLSQDFYYRPLIASVSSAGINNYVRHFPADPYHINIHYFNPLAWDGHSLIELPKALPKYDFVDYAGYYGFLMDTVRALGANAADGARHHRVIPITTVSSGYDSVAVSVIAREAGCQRAFSIADSSSMWRGSDNGYKIADRLGLNCHVYRQKDRNYRDEVSIIGTVGRFGALSFTLFDYPEPLSLLFTGGYGDHVWDRYPHDFSNPRGTSEMFLEEFRLSRGIFQTAVPWWAPNNFSQINALGSLPEMAPWTLNTDYDRPVPRRIGEEAGIPRTWFGMSKKNTSAERTFKWPYTLEAQASFTAYLERNGKRVPPTWVMPLIIRLAQIDGLISSNLLHRLMPRSWDSRRRIVLWRRYSHQERLFVWANEILSQRYSVARSDK